MTLQRAACLSIVLLWPAMAAAGKPQLVAAFDDATVDAYGPGSYIAPGDSEINDGDFDLRRFEVWLDGREVVFKVTMASPFREPGATARTGAVQIAMWNRIYLQNIDIYIDTNPKTAIGYTACVPGRRVGFPVGQSWKVAVVLTPQPGPAQNITEDALGEAGQHVLFPKNLQVSGRTVIARVPVFDLGGAPERNWGYSVQVSGASWERTFSAVDRLRDRAEKNAFTMPVLPVREAWAFGGAPEGKSFPRVIDVLLPKGVDQKRVLGGFDEGTGRWARVPFVSLEPRPVIGAVDLKGEIREVGEIKGGKGEEKAGVGVAKPLTIVDFVDTAVTIDGDVAGVKVMMIGRVVDGAGTTVARVIVGKVLDHGLIASVIDGGANLSRGAVVKFDAAGK